MVVLRAGALIGIVFGLCFATTVVAAPLPAASTCRVEVRPGEGIGPIEVGVSVTALRARGIELTTDPQFSAMKRHRDLLILLSPDRARVQAVELARDRFGRCVRVGDVALTRTMALEEMAARLGRCGPVDMRTGGTIVPCGDGLELRSTLAGIGVLVAAGDTSTAPDTICRTYVSSGPAQYRVFRGKDAWHVSKKKGRALDVRALAPICLGARVFSGQITAERFKYELCSEIAHPALKQLNCGELGYRFGPDGRLRELLLYPYAQK